MKALTATLLAAQKKADRTPYVEAKVYDYEAGIKRLSWSRLYSGDEPDNHHGIAFDGQGSMHRIRAQGSNLYYQKVTDPGPSSDYSPWTLIASDCEGPCAIAASPAEAPPAQAGKIYIFYRKTDNTLRKYYTHNYGVDWTNAELAAYTEVVSLAACWWGTSDVVHCFALKGSFPAKLNGLVLNTTTQVVVQHEWDDENHPLLDTYGIGATYNAPLQQCEIVLAAKESDTPYHHFDLFRTKFSNTYNFLALESFLMAPDGEDITYEYPDCHLPAVAPGEGGPDYETTRITAAEKFVGTTPYTRPIACHQVKGTYWSDTTFTEPRPFLPDVAPGVGGLRLQSTPEYWWLSKPDGLWRAPRPALPAIVLTSAGDIISLQTNVIASPDSSGRGNLIIELDNSRGQYSPIPSGLRFRSEIALKLGYKTTAGEEAVEAGTYWVDSWEHSSTPNQSLFTIHCLDGSGLMARWTARYQMRWNKDDVNPRSVWQILYQLLARVGILLTNTPTKPQSSAINNFYPDFTITPGSNGQTVVKQLLALVPDQLVFRGQEAFTKNPLPAEASSYSYGAGAAGHVILSGKYTEAVTLSRARALGEAEDHTRIVEESIDWYLLSLGVDILEQVYDPNLTDAARAQERADAILRDASLLAQRSNLVVPTNVGQEPLDVVTITDVRCGVSAEEHRLLAIQTDYDRRKGQYDQRLALGAP